MENKRLEKYSSAFTLSDMEIFVDMEMEKRSMVCGN
jgi:hypothetical protein